MDGWYVYTRAYDPAEYAHLHLRVSPEVQELFGFITQCVVGRRVSRFVRVACISVCVRACVTFIWGLEGKVPVMCVCYIDSNG